MQGRVGPARLLVSVAGRKRGRGRGREASAPAEEADVRAPAAEGPVFEGRREALKRDEVSDPLSSGWSIHSDGHGSDTEPARTKTFN